MTNSELHAMVVHFPIALLLVSFALELVALYRPWRPWLRPAALVTLALGTAGALAAVLTGPERNAAGVSRLGRIHETWGRVTLLVFLALLAWRLVLLWRRREMGAALLALYLALAAVGIGTLGYTGYLGGKMVYEEAVGVRRGGQWVAPPAFREGPRR